MHHNIVGKHENTHDSGTCSALTGVRCASRTSYHFCMRMGIPIRIGALVRACARVPLHAMPLHACGHPCARVPLVCACGHHCAHKGALLCRFFFPLLFFFLCLQSINSNSLMLDEDLDYMLYSYCTYVTFTFICYLRNLYAPSFVSFIYMHHLLFHSMKMNAEISYS